MNDTYLDELTVEFAGLALDGIYEAQRRIDAMAAAGPAPDALRAIRRQAHTLKGNGGSFGYPNVSLIAHRLEDYLVHAGPALSAPSLRPFFDRLEDVFNGRLPRDGEAERVIANLPRAHTFDVSDVTRQEIDVVLVMENATQARLVRRELEACGYSVVLIAETLAALDYIHRTRPDLVVASAVMPGLSGVELLIALKALPATRAVPCALLTSFTAEDRDLGLLPPGIPVIHKGKEFSDQFAAALSRLKIT